MQNNTTGFYQLLFFLCLFSLQSCLSTRSALEHIPSESSVVIKVNLLSLALKLFKNEPQAVQDFANILGTEIDDNPNKVARKLRKSGLNILRSYIYIKLGQNEESFVACNFAIRNYDRFNEFMERFEVHTIEWQDSLNYTYLNDQVILGWDAELMVLLTMPKNNTREDLLNQYLTIRKLPEKLALIENDENFEEHNKKWSDVSVWVDMEKLHDLEKVQAFQQSREIFSNIDLDSNYLNLRIVLKHGVVNTEVNYSMNDSTAQKYKLLLKKGLNPDVVKDAPVANPNGLLAIGLDPVLLPELFADLELDDEMERVASLVEMETSDLINTFSGDFVLLMKEVRNQKEQHKEDIISTSDWHYEVAIGLALSEDRSVFDEIMATLLETQLLKKEEHELHYVFFEEIFLFERENIVYLTKSNAFHESFEVEEILDNDTLTFQSASNGVLINLTKEGWQNLFKPIMKEPKNAWLEKVNQLPITNINFQLSALENNVLNGKVVLTMENKKENTVVPFYFLLRELFLPDSELKHKMTEN